MSTKLNGLMLYFPGLHLRILIRCSYPDRASHPTIYTCRRRWMCTMWRTGNWTVNHEWRHNVLLSLSGHAETPVWISFRLLDGCRVGLQNRSLLTERYRNSNFEGQKLSEVRSRLIDHRTSQVTSLHFQTAQQWLSNWAYDRGLLKSWCYK